jgi:hypothetical protein
VFVSDALAYAPGTTLWLAVALGFVFVNTAAPSAAVSANDSIAEISKLYYWHFDFAPEEQVHLLIGC